MSAVQTTLAPKPLAIDPPACDCKLCITGVYKPLDQTTPEERLEMVRRRIRDNTGMSFLGLYAWERANQPNVAPLELVPA